MKSESEEISQAVKMGQRSKELIPAVKNWCKHVRIKDHSTGLITQMYNVPTMLALSCPHTANSLAGMDFEGIAESFIIENCRECKFHHESTKLNFGQEVLARYNTQVAKQIEEQKDKEIKFKDVKGQIDELIKKEKKNIETPQLSILKLVEELQTADNQDTFKKLLEASKISPELFSNAAIDFIVLIGTESNNEILFQTIAHLADYNNSLTAFAIERIDRYLPESSLDVVFGIFDKVTKKLDGKRDLLYRIPDSLKYHRFFGEPYGARTYPNAVKLFSRLYREHKDIFKEIITSKLSNQDKVNRINLNGLLQALIDVDSNVVLEFVEPLIKSFDFKEDRYGESADGTTIETIGKIFLIHPEVVIGNITFCYPNLSLGGKIVCLEMLRKLLTLKEVIVPKYAKSLVDILIEECFNSSQDEIVKEAIENIRYTVVDNPKVFQEHFSALLGLYIKLSKDRDKHEMYLKELDKPLNQVSTFNPLAHLKSWEIMNIETSRMRKHKDLEAAIVFIGMSMEDDAVKNINSVIDGLSSKHDGAIKSELINILRQTSNDKLVIAQLLSNIHTWLFDIDSKAVRMEAVKFLDLIFEKHHDLATHTLLSIAKIFLDDPEIGVKYMALRAFSTLITFFPNEVEPQHIDKVLDLMGNKYVLLHKGAIELTFDIYPFLSLTKKRALVLQLLHVEKVYFDNKDYHYCKELWPKLLFTSKEFPDWYNIIITKVLPKYCDVDEFYIRQDAIEKLTELYFSDEHLADLWLQMAIKYLRINRRDQLFENPEYSLRYRLFKYMYDLPIETIRKNASLFSDAIKEFIETDDHDSVFNFLGILGFYRLHSVSLTELTLFNSEKLKLNEYKVSKELCELLLKITKRENDIQTI